MKTPKYFIGPMTQNVIDAVIEFVEENDVVMGFIASRRQIEYNSGYTGYNTLDFSKYVKSKTNKILLCRDHGGVFQGELGYFSTTYADIQSFLHDANSGMHIIHIDPWKKYSNPNQYELGLNETINNIFLINECNSQIRFEVGTEEAIRPFNEDEFFNFLNNLKTNLGDIFKNVQYAVIQSGTRLLGTKNTGNFNLAKLKNMTNICKEFGVLSKEHNGDYLTVEELKIRFDNGLDGINIAPEYGVLETKTLLNHIKNNADIQKIYDICYKGNKWVKWLPKYFNANENKLELIEVCGHYHNKQIKEIVNMDDEIIKNVIKEDLTNKLMCIK